MNLALKSQLSKAYNYLCAREKYERDWGANQRLLARYKNMSTVTLREYRKSVEKKEEKFKFEWIYLFVPVFFVLGLLIFQVPMSTVDIIAGVLGLMAS